MLLSSIESGALKTLTSPRALSSLGDASGEGHAVFKSLSMRNDYDSPYGIDRRLALRSFSVSAVVPESGEAKLCW